MQRTGIVCLLALTVAAAGATRKPVTPGTDRQGPLLRHSATWVRARLLQMHATDDAYLWHDVLGGRAIHQNSYTNPPTTPLQGNFHTQQQSYFALMKLHLYDLLGRKDEKLLDDAKVLLDWVLDHGYNPKTHTFAFRYNWKRKDWIWNFYPEFNIISVAALLRYNALRPAPRYAAAANDVFGTITRVGWDTEHGGFMSGFKPDPKTGKLTGGGGKGLYGSGYLALMMLDAHDSTGQKRFLEWAKKAVDSCNEHLWDKEFGAWLPGTNRQWDPPKHGTKFTHIIADMIQANYLLYLKGQGDSYLDYAEKALAFLAKHNRAPNGLWYRHNTRDGSDPRKGPEAPGDGGPGTAVAYDRQMQAVVACVFGWQATRNQRYLDYIDATLATMEHTHRMVYPAGVNYGYMGASGENTWCHLWGLKGFIAIARLQADALEAGAVETAAPPPPKEPEPADGDGDGVPDAAERVLGMDPARKDTFTEVYRGKPVGGPDASWGVTRLSVASPGGCRVVFRAEFPPPFDPRRSDLVIYIDADRNRATGRKSGWADTTGTELSVMVRAEGGNAAVFDPKVRVAGAPPTAGVGAGGVAYIADDLNLPIQGGKATIDVKLLTHARTGDGATPSGWLTITFPMDPTGRTP